jgi:hypothetical protein
LRCSRSIEEILVRKWILGFLSLAVGFGFLATAGSAQAADKKIDTINCEEFLAMNADGQNRIAYWVDGYAQAKGEAAVDTVAFDKFGQPIDELVADCKATPKETLWKKIKKHL